MLLDFRLNVFITVSRTLSFSKAASILNITQPAVSRHIKELEQDFGEPLFNRQGASRMSLTKKGWEIIPLVQNILDGYAHLKDAVYAPQDDYEGVLHIGASTTIAQYALPAILAKFNKTYPRIKLSVISANSDEVIDMLRRKDIEVALIEGDNTSRSVHYAEFASDEIVLVSTKSMKRSLEVEELAKIPLLIREEGSGTLSVIQSALKAVGVSRKGLNIKMQLGSSESIVRYLKESSDFAFLSILVVKERVERGELYICNVKGLHIARKFRFATLHGQGGRLVGLFQSFCSSHYNI